MEFLFLYLFLVNAASFLLMLIDKHRAVKNRWRIPEATLMLFAAIGGSLGGVLGMKIFRHKTLHLKFSLGFPLLLALHSILLLYIL